MTAALGRATGAATATGWLLRWNHFARGLAAFLARHDVWLTPTVAAPPLPHGATDPPAAQRLVLQLLDGSRLLTPLARSGVLQPVVDALARDNLAPYPFTQLANLTGVPAMSLPLHWTAEGLPLGVQCIGRMGDDALLLRLAAQVETAQPWFDRLPPLARASVAG